MNTIIVVAVLLIVFYLIGARADKSEDLYLGDNEASAISSVPNKGDEEKKLEDIYGDVPEVLSDFYLSNSLRFAFPERNMLGWKSRNDSTIEISELGSFSTESTELKEGESLFVYDFLESRGFTQSPINSYIEGNYKTEAFETDSSVCLLRSIIVSKKVSQTLSCADLII